MLRRLAWGQQVGRLDPVDGDRVQRTIFVLGHGRVLLQGSSDGIYAHEDLGARVQFLSNEDFPLGRAGLYWLKTLHGTHEASGEILDAAGAATGVGVSSLHGNRRLVP